MTNTIAERKEQAAVIRLDQVFKDDFLRIYAKWRDGFTRRQRGMIHITHGTCVEAMCRALEEKIERENLKFFFPPVTLYICGMGHSTPSLVPETCDECGGEKTASLYEPQVKL